MQSSHKDWVMVLSIHALGFCFNNLELHIQYKGLSNSPIQEWRTEAPAKRTTSPRITNKNHKVLIQLVCGHMQISQMSLVKEVWWTLPEIPRFQVFPHSAVRWPVLQKKEFKLLVSLFTQKHISTTEQVTTEHLVLSSAQKELAI